MIDDAHREAFERVLRDSLARTIDTVPARACPFISIFASCSAAHARIRRAERMELPKMYGDLDLPPGLMNPER
jgi:hypothetical protein